MPEILQYGFMVRALIAGLLVALALPVLGSFLVARRYSLIADSLAHMSLAGVGLGLLLGTSPVMLAVPVTVAGAALLEYLRQKRRLSGETGLAILMSGGLALAVVFASLAHGRQVDFTSYLFGSITTTSESDLWVLAGTVMVVLVVAFAKYRAFLHMSFDEDSARIAGHKVSLLNYVLVILTAVTVVLAMRIVGGLLISALLVIPVITAAQFARSFRATMIVAVAVALVAVLGGLIAAFYLGVAAGGAIVLAALALFGLALLFAP
jgi:zinc transport system permease protein